MLRAVLVGVLSLSAVACKSGSDSPTSQPGVAAGKVIEVSGTVTVQHDGVARPLAKGDSVEGDDVVETGADGNVIVELAHNLARWELGPNKKSKVRESVAWGLAKKSGETGNVQQDTAAAGRPAERSAADTSVTAAPEAKSETIAAPAATAAPPAPPAAEPSPRAEAPAKAASKRPLDNAIDGEGGAAPKPPARGLEAERESAKDTAVLTRGANKGAPPPPPADGTDSAPSPVAAARDLVIKQQASIKACLTKDAQAVSLRIVIGADGKATVVVKGKAEVPDSVRRCVTSAVDKISFAKAAATVTIEIAR